MELREGEKGWVRSSRAGREQDSGLPRAGAGYSLPLSSSLGAEPVGAGMKTHHSGSPKLAASFGPKLGCEVNAYSPA